MRENLVEGYRLSPQQRHIWLLQQDDHSSAYYSQCVVMIDGELDPGALRAAIEDVVSRHEILRTTFVRPPGDAEPLQVINGDQSAQVTEHDLSALSASEQEAKLEALIQQARRSPIEFEDPRQLNATVVTLSARSRVLVITVSALCSDLTGLNNIVGEISRACAVILRGEKRKDVSAHYADFSEWQNELLVSEETQEVRDFWRLQNIPAFLNAKLPFEKSPALRPPFEPSISSFTINADSLAQIESLTRTHETSLPVFLQACWQVLLWRLAGESEIVVGAAFSGRKYDELRESLGLFAKYLPIGCRFEADLRFSEVMPRVAQASSEAYKREEYFDWEQVTGPGASGAVFFPFCFEFIEDPPAYFADGLTLTTLGQYACIDRFKVKLCCYKQGGSLIVEVHYDSSLFTPDDMRRLAGHLGKLMESAAAGAEATIAELEILTETDRHQLLVEFNCGGIDYPKDRCIHKLFEEQAARTPDRIAVKFEDRQLTYADLNARANHLGAYLQMLGVGPEVLVAICVDRSLEMAVGILGVLKAGGAYVPVDPASPNERLAFMLRDAGSALLLTQDRLANHLPDCGARIVCLDTEWNVIGAHSSENPASEVTADNLAYAIYTSGSTGTPKGVLITHQSLVSYVFAIVDRLRLEAGDKILQLAAFSFDVLVEELFPAWTIGACVILQEEQLLNSPAELLRIAEQEEVTAFEVTTAYWRELVHELTRTGKPLPPALRMVLMGGERVALDTVREWQKTHTPLMHVYGITETSVTSTVYELAAGAELQEGQTELPIGTPIGNTRIYLLDKLMRPVAIGVAGEICICGPAVARGYGERADLTAERFLPEPYSGRAGERMYRSGDMGRYVSGGEIEFIGRADEQVKVRGYRIELGEIETVLLQHQSVREAVVVVRQEAAGDKRLAAYVVSTAGHEPRTAEMREHLKERLPDYMVPSDFIILEKLPLTPNGKIDRQALPAPDHGRASLQGSLAGPRNAVEEALARIWQEVLGIDRIGIHDNFFELGGDSILIIQVVARANQRGIHLTPKLMFQHQSIAELAEQARRSEPVEAEQSAVTGEVPLTPIQQWFLEQPVSDVNHFNQAVLLATEEEIDGERMRRVAGAIMEQHDALRLRYERSGAGWRQMNQEKVEEEVYREVEIGGETEAEQRAEIERVAKETQESLDIERGKIVAVVSMRLAGAGSGGRGRLLMVIHHLAVDVVSWRIVLEDLQRGYEQAGGGEEIKLGAKTTSYKRWSERMEEEAQTAEMEQEAEYWLSKARLNIKSLPRDYAEGANSFSSARDLTVSLNANETHSLIHDVPSSYNTQFNDVLLTALAAALSRWTEEHRSLIDVEGHGREDIVENVDLSRTVGWFTSLYPVLLEMRENTEPGDALKAIKEQLRGIPNRGIGYGLLRYVNRNHVIRKSLLEMPQAELSFNYMGQLDRNVQMSDIFSMAKESCGPMMSSKAGRRYLIEINASVVEGQLKLIWTYSENVHHRATVESLARGFMDALRAFIVHCQSLQAVGYTPSDFPLAQLDQFELDEAFAEVEFEGAFTR